jgi:N-acetylmuramoyl-L-alanine amidase
VTVFHHPGSKDGKHLAISLFNSIAESLIFKMRQVKVGRWLYLLRKTTCPSVLIELGFHDNKEDVAIMKQPDYPQRIAKAICDGVEGFEAL